MLKSIKNYFNHRSLKEKSYSFLFEDYNGNEVVVFDTETTGLDPKVDEVLSIGAVLVRDNVIVTSETFELFLRPSNDISAKSIEIHHIRPCDLEDAVEPLHGIKMFLEFIGNRPLVGYYLEFDIAMINRYLKPWLGIVLPNTQLEVSALYFDKKIGLIPQGNIDLRFDTILRELNLPNMGQHNAVNDAIMTAMIYQKLRSTKSL